MFCQNFVSLWILLFVHLPKLHIIQWIDILLEFRIRGSTTKIVLSTPLITNFNTRFIIKKCDFIDIDVFNKNSTLFNDKWSYLGIRYISSQWSQKLFFELLKNVSLIILFCIILLWFVMIGCFVFVICLLMGLLICQNITLIYATHFVNLENLAQKTYLITHKIFNV